MQFCFSGEPTYTCTYEGCNRHFDIKSSFVAHMAMHDREKGFTCKVRDGPIIWTDFLHHNDLDGWVGQSQYTHKDCVTSKWVNLN